MGDGYIDGDIIVCPWHGWSYDIKTGVSPANPVAKLATFKVKIEDTHIFIDV